MLNRRAEHRLASVLSREWGKQSLLFWVWSPHLALEEERWRTHKPLNSLQPGIDVEQGWGEK